MFRKLTGEVTVMAPDDPLTSESVSTIPEKQEILDIVSKNTIYIYMINRVNILFCFRTKVKKNFQRIGFRIQI